MENWLEVLGGYEPGTYFQEWGVVVLHDDDADGVVDRIAAVGADGQVREHVLRAEELERWSGNALPGPGEHGVHSGEFPAPADQLEGWCGPEGRGRHGDNAGGDPHWGV